MFRAFPGVPSLWLDVYPMVMAVVECLEPVKSHGIRCVFAKSHGHSRRHRF